MTDDRWIIIPNWDKFQSDRTTSWIRLYLELNSRDDWTRLSLATRGMLTTCWLEYARSACQLRASRVMQVCGKSARSAHLEALNQAGFIEFSDDQPSRARAGARSGAGSREERREPAKAGSLSKNETREEKEPASPQQAAPPTPFEQARNFVRNAGHMDPSLARTLREDRPELTAQEVDSLVEYAATLNGNA
jgi:hypothetical protein